MSVSTAPADADTGGDSLNASHALHAWFDNELPSQQSTDIAERLHDRPLEQAVVDAWSADREALRMRLDPIAQEPIPMRLQQIVWTRGPASLTTHWQRWAVISAVFALGGLLGGMAAWFAARESNATIDSPALTGWLRRAVVAHRVYAAEELRAVEFAVDGRNAAERRARQGAMAAWLTSRVDVPVTPFDLQKLEFRLLGGRLLPDVSGAGAQLMYQHASGQRITIYIRRPDRIMPVRPPSPDFQRWGDVGLFYWDQGDAAYALVGDLPRERLLALTEVVLSQLAAQRAADRP